MEKGRMYSELSLGVCAVTFIKKNGESRCMLCTRNVKIAGRVVGYMKSGLDGVDRRNSKNPSTVGVIDLEIGEIRNINMDTVVNFKIYDGVNDYESFKKAFEDFTEYKENYYDSIKGSEIRVASLDDLDANGEIKETVIERQKINENLNNNVLGNIDLSNM